MLLLRAGHCAFLGSELMLFGYVAYHLSWHAETVSRTCTASGHGAPSEARHGRVAGAFLPRGSMAQLGTSSSACVGVGNTVLVNARGIDARDCAIRRHEERGRVHDCVLVVDAALPDSRWVGYELALPTRSWKTADIHHLLTTHQHAEVPS
eukprot:366551-Chlamydomonas_euryale.AAC.21